STEPPDARIECVEIAARDDHHRERRRASPPGRTRARLPAPGMTRHASHGTAGAAAWRRIAWEVWVDACKTMSFVRSKVGAACVPALLRLLGLPAGTPRRAPQTQSPRPAQNVA